MNQSSAGGRLPRVRFRNPLAHLGPPLPRGCSFPPRVGPTSQQGGPLSFWRAAPRLAGAGLSVPPRPRLSPAASGPRPGSGATGMRGGRPSPARPRVDGGAARSGEPGRRSRRQVPGARAPRPRPPPAHVPLPPPRGPGGARRIEKRKDKSLPRNPAGTGRPALPPPVSSSPGRRLGTRSGGGRREAGPALGFPPRPAAGGPRGPSSAGSGGGAGRGGQATPPRAACPLAWRRGRRRRPRPRRRRPRRPRWEVPYKPRLGRPRRS